MVIIELIDLEKKCVGYRMVKLVGAREEWDGRGWWMDAAFVKCTLCKSSPAEWL